MKTIKTIIILVVIVLLFWYQSNLCNTRVITEQIRVFLYDYPEIPEKVKLYVYRRGNKFIRPIMEVENIFNPKVDTFLFPIKKIPKEHIQFSIPIDIDEYYKKKEYIWYTFSTSFLKNRDYRIVINDTIYYDISDLVFDVKVDSSRVSMFGVYLRNCVIFDMKVNGKKFDEEFHYLLYSSSFSLPYSMRRVVEK